MPASIPECTCTPVDLPSRRGGTIPSRALCPQHAVQETASNIVEQEVRRASYDDEIIE